MLMRPHVRSPGADAGRGEPRSRCRRGGGEHPRVAAEAQLEHARALRCGRQVLLAVCIVHLLARMLTFVSPGETYARGALCIASA